MHKIAATSAASLAGKIGMVAIVYATHLSLAWLFGAQLMGTFFIASNLVLFCGMVCPLGLDYGLLRFASMLQEQGKAALLGDPLRKGLTIALGLSSSLALGIYLGRAWLAKYLNAPGLEDILPVFALALPPLTAIALLRETIRGLGAVLYATLVHYVVQPGILFVLLVLFFYLTPLVMEMSQALSLAFLFSFIFILILFIRRLTLITRGWQKSAPKTQLWKELFHYSVPLFFTTIINLSLTLSDCLILALFRPPEQVAWYGTALKLASIVALPLTAITAVISPLFVQYFHRGELVELENLARTTARWMFILAFPACLLMILLSHDILSFFGPDFSAARWGLSLLVMGQLFSVSVGSVGYLLILTGHQYPLLKLQLLTVIITIPLMFFMSYQYGLNGTAISTSFGVIFNNLLASIAVKKLLGIKSFVRNVTLLSLGSLASFGICWLMQSKIGTIWATAAFILLYLIILINSEWKQTEWRLLWKLSEIKRN